MLKAAARKSLSPLRSDRTARARALAKRYIESGLSKHGGGVPSNLSMILKWTVVLMMQILKFSILSLHLSSGLVASIGIFQFNAWSSTSLMALPFDSSSLHSLTHTPSLFHSFTFTCDYAIRSDLLFYEILSYMTETYGTLSSFFTHFNPSQLLPASWAGR